MSRSGYSDDIDDWDLIRWRGRVASATRGRRGQQFFVDLLAALDGMPQQRLIAEDLEREGEVCAIGSLGVRRGVDMAGLDPKDAEKVGRVFGIAPCLAQEVVYVNDERGDHRETPERRWVRMRDWVAGQIRQEATGG